MNASVRSLRSHGGMKVGQMIKPPRSPDCGKTRSIKAKEIHTRLAVMFHVSADVEFRKTREARQRRKSAAVNAAHAEWNDSDPALAVVGVEGELLRDERPDGFNRKRPVGEEQVVPRLLHDPLACGQGPRTMSHGLQERMHLTFYRFALSRRSIDVSIAMRQVVVVCLTIARCRIAD